MAGDTDPPTLFERLMILSQEAFEIKHYSTAYHILAAALHEATEYADLQGLSTVERIAHEQLSMIARDAPQYEHSTSSATTRSRTSIFELLATQAHTARMLVRLELRRKGVFP